MRVDFGWSLDGAPWMSEPSGGTTVVTGPLGFLGILQTRLGATRPTVNVATRIAQYRALMATADHEWYRESFTVDPWNTAGNLLRLRDDAIEAGWRPGDESVSYENQPRLVALASIESHNRLGQRGDQRANFNPGPADDLREVLTLLRELPDAWPLGVSQLRLRDDRSHLPRVWQEVINAIEARGVSVTQAERSTRVPAALSVVRGPDEWSTAEAAARWLANCPDARKVCIIAGDATDVLDQQLVRRGAATLGVPRSSAMSPAGQVLPLFLSSIIPPVDVRRVGELLNFRFQAATEDEPAQPFSILPRAVAKKLLDALVEEPGITDDPDSAWMTALNTLHDEAAQSRAAEKNWEAAQTIDGFLRSSQSRAQTQPLADSINKEDPNAEADNTPGTVALATILPALDWLARRMQSIARQTDTRTTAATSANGDSSFASQAATHISAFRESLEHLGEERVRVRELFDIVDTSAPAPFGTTQATAAAWTVVTDPAHVPLGTETIVWWSSHRSDFAVTDIWDHDEAVAMAETGATVTPASLKERLNQAAALDGVRSATTLICFCPENLRGDQSSLHPALMQLAEVLVESHPERFSDAGIDAVLDDSSVARPVASHRDGDTWQLRGASTALTEVEPEDFSPPASVTRTHPGDFSHLLPERLSYSQIELLLNDPFAWTLRHGLGLKRGFSAEVATGNQMIGSLVHSVVEHLILDGAATDGSVPSDETISATFDRLVPRFAAELLLPGQQARLGMIKSISLSSLTALFSTLARREISITGAEVDFASSVTLSISSEPTTFTLVGTRDLDGSFADGRPAVIDLKWTNWHKGYRAKIDTGEAVQLSVYAHAVGTPSSSNPLTAYYLLKQGRFVSTDLGLDPDFSGGARDNNTVDSLGVGDPFGLWPRIQKSVEYALTSIVEGRFEAVIADDIIAETNRSEQRRSADGTEELGPKKSVAAEGRLLIDRPQEFSDYNLIYGLAGDYS
ncbi:RecB family exonuclease [Brevibacterium aurantiacum]|uniref:PD-(D/E)XK endonuclease-like domain-containing protein n=1 Tax=Brevibacterium aurantiacum TaxID=273384 RepID=A0A3Q9NXZ9_BREAU|nr:PD-(D/E)XK nuclease family protein [Brevibacterium aurantiacum]AZT97726.1 hypothetical protein CXR27_12520 [Brevibacterium aurantiacum]